MPCLGQLFFYSLDSGLILPYPVFPHLQESELPGGIPTFGDYHKVSEVYLFETNLLATCSKFCPVGGQVEPLVVHAPVTGALLKEEGLALSEQT
ncbi:hypothetical protein O181_036807 [Austropuccinia psidii MF-1]|uniref:Uncharacterized protein n=1 Tax=Austropuccinia psidii MF-1 TaxID=1389203 RepID=A0A9Q3D7S4_9BASI|nr:hypothetical protein [Austropuccinia psidii MF-1]